MSYGDDYRAIQEATVTEQEKLPPEYLDDRGYPVFKIDVEPVELLLTITIKPELPSYDLKNGALQAVKKVRGVYGHTVEWTDDETIEVWVGVNYQSDLRKVESGIEDAIIDYLDDVG